MASLEIDWVLVISIIGGLIAVVIVFKRHFPGKEKYVWQPETEYDIETEDYKMGNGRNSMTGDGIATEIRLKPKRNKPHRGPQRRL